MQGSAKILKREFLIPLFIVFAILSVLVGISLLIYFIYIFQGYFVKVESGGFALINPAQEVDFMGLIYGVIWTLLGFFFYIISLRLKLIELRYRVNQYTNDQNLLWEQEFETRFLNYSRQQLEILNSLNHSFEEQNTVAPEGSKMSEINGADFFVFIRERMALLMKAIQRKKYPDNPDDYVEKQERNNLDLMAIGHRKYNSIIYNINVESEMEVAKAAYSEVYKFYHYYLFPYFNNLSMMLKHISSIMNEEYENIVKDRSNIVDKYSRFAKAHLSSGELSIIFYHSLFDTDFRQIVNEHKLNENLAPYDLIKKNHIDLSKHI